MDTLYVDITHDDHHTEQTVGVREMYIHPNHGTNGFQFNYDFCLLRTFPISINSQTTANVCLPSAPIEASLDQMPDNCHVAGWGLLSSDGLIARASV